MATTHFIAYPNGFRVRLLEGRTGSYTVVVDKEHLAEIDEFTTDFAFAKKVFEQAVQIAALGLITHPAWSA